MRALRILFVEDTEDDLFIVVRELQRGGIRPTWRRVDSAGELADALSTEAWDLVLCDYSLPGFDALSARAIVAAHADLPFIVVSGTVGEEVAVELMRGGAHDFVLKDRLARLVPAIERELREAASRAELRRAEDTLRRSDKLRALGQMSTGIAHDLKNLLNPLGLHLEIIERAMHRGGVDKPASVAAIRSIIARGVETIDRLRAFSRQAPERIVARVELAELAREALAMVRPRLDGLPGVAIAEALLPAGEIAAQPEEVVGAVVNLLGNALDACGERGHVTVRVGGDEHHAWIEVADDGPGMTAEIEAQVFEPFFSTKGADGTGLGLANVFATMQRHAGSVVLDTAPGRGARFTLRFPRMPVV